MRYLQAASTPIQSNLIYSNPFYSPLLLINSNALPAKLPAKVRPWAPSSPPLSLSLCACLWLPTGMKQV